MKNCQDVVIIENNEDFNKLCRKEHMEPEKMDIEQLSETLWLTYGVTLVDARVCRFPYMQ